MMQARLLSLNKTGRAKTMGKGWWEGKLSLLKESREHWGARRPVCLL